MQIQFPSHGILTFSYFTNCRRQMKWNEKQTLLSSPDRSETFKNHKLSHFQKNALISQCSYTDLIDDIICKLAKKRTFLMPCSKMHLYTNIIQSKKAAFCGRFGGKKYFVLGYRLFPAEISGRIFTTPHRIRVFFHFHLTTK